MRNLSGSQQEDDLMLLTSGPVTISTKVLWRTLTQRSLPNARNPTDPTVCSQFAFSLPSPVLGRWNHVLKTSMFPPPIHLMRSIFAVCFQRRSEPRQNSECGNSRSEGRIIDSSSTNAVNFFSVRTTKRFPSLRCASATKIVRPLESTPETQPQLQPASLRLSAISSQYFTPGGFCLFSAAHGNDEIKGSRSVDFRRSGMASVVHPTNANERVAALGVVRALPTFAHVCRFIGEITGKCGKGLGMKRHTTRLTDEEKGL